MAGKSLFRAVLLALTLGLGAGASLAQAPPPATQPLQDSDWLTCWQTIGAGHAGRSCTAISIANYLVGKTNSFPAMQTFVNGLAQPNLGTHGLVLSQGASPETALSLSAGSLLVGQGASADPQGLAPNGDCTMNASAKFTCLYFNGVPILSAAGYAIGTAGANVPLLNGANTWAAKQLFTPSAANAAINVGELASNPTSLVDGDMWVTPSGAFARSNGQTIQLGGSAFGVSSFTSPGGSIQYGAVTMQSQDVTNALGYTPLNKAGDTMSGNLNIGGNVGATNGTFSGTLAAAGTATLSGGADVATQNQPANVTTGGIRLRGNSNNNLAYLQVTDTSGQNEWGYFKFQPNGSGGDSGPATWQGGAFTFPNGINANVTGNLTGSVAGNATSATKLQTARSIALSGDINCSTNFDGSANASLTGCNLPNYTTAATIGSNGAWWNVPYFSVDAKGRVNNVWYNVIPAAGVGTNGYVGLASAYVALVGSDNSQALTANSLAANSPGWKSCGSNCTAHVIEYPGGVVQISGLYDCGSNACYTNGTWVNIILPVNVGGCLGLVATPYNPGQFNSPAYNFEMINSAYLDLAHGVNYITVRSNGYQSSSAHAIEGFSFVMTCHT